ncbi:enhancer of mRNA-decapping protein 4-like isoform X2 [Artemia franciscana]|uniref:Enhancer of mRNA-decapping protein 4 n=1 Tax=Artemia franciscana TaxID=6661 RepID=A0AA88LB24_ARTSF|nr:hypothetical protein QYM36_001347 [Artemia franciscana]KAK2724843.1 hypothetical protein QYM36_001347 [Artemia franciscana]KAK2724846.1 hypothetical protein QYM36_001347 [Artemia franciscana]
MSEDTGQMSDIQEIHFEGRDDFHCVELQKAHALINVTKAVAAGRKGSSSVKVSQVVSSLWDKTFLLGKQVAVDKTRTYLAYCIKLPKSAEGSTAVRVVDILTKSRTLIRGLRGVIRDLSFSFHVTRTMLAIVDEQGTLFVTEILRSSGDELNDLKIRKLLQVERSLADPSLSINRVIWCGYVPDDEKDDSSEDPAYLLFVTTDDKAELWNLLAIGEEYGNRSVHIDDVGEGYCSLDFDGKCTSASFSPDGSALAVASTSGLVKFFEVRIKDINTSYQPKVLHQWTPHEGKPVSYIEFIDNLLENNADESKEYWKFVIVGSCDNTEIKIYTCENWKCQQTISFLPEKDSGINKLQLNIGMDLTRKFIVLSDIQNSVLYVGDIGDKNGISVIHSLTQLFFGMPVISFDIYDVTAGSRDERDYETFGDVNNDIELHLFIVQEKALSDCAISYSRVKEVEPMEAQTLPEQPVREESPDIAIEEAIIVTENVQPCLRDIKPPEEPSVNLMTPFQVSGNGIDSYEPYQRPPSHSAFSPLNADLVNSTLKPHTPPLTQSSVNDLLNFAHARKVRSGASSPSREVASIMDQTMEQFRHLGMEDRPDENESKAGPSRPSPISELLSKGPLPQPMVPTNNMIPVPVLASSNGHSQQSNIVMDMLADVIHGIQPAQLPPLPDASCPPHWQPTVPSPPLPDLARRESPSQGSRETRDLENLLSNAIANFEMATRKLDSMQVNQQALVNLQKQLQTLKDEQSILVTEIGALRQAQRADNFEKKIADIMCKQIASYQDALTLSVSQTVASSLPSRVENHIKSLLLPAVTRGLEPAQKVIQQELESFCESNRRSLDKEIIKRIAVMEDFLKSHLTKLVQSKEFLNALSQSIASPVNQVIQGVFKDVTYNHLIPSYDRACQQMFLQMNEALTRGVKEVIQTADVHMQKQRCGDEASVQVLQSTLKRLNEITDSLPERLSQSWAKVATEVGEQMADVYAKSSTQLAQRITGSVRDEVSRIMREQQIAIDKTLRAATPAPVVADITVILSTLIAQSCYNEAFEKVLFAKDLKLLMSVCQKVDPVKLFSIVPCPLTQAVILSLIQQLSQNLKSQSELKLQYLEEAITVFDKNNPIVSAHSPAVKSLVTRGLEELADTPHAGRAKRLSLVASTQM